MRIEKMIYLGFGVITVGIFGYYLFVHQPNMNTTSYLDTLTLPLIGFFFMIVTFVTKSAYLETYNVTKVKQ